MVRMLVLVLVALVRAQEKGPPAVAGEVEEVVVAGVGEEARLRCPVRGHPTPLIEWTKVTSCFILSKKISSFISFNCTSQS